MTDSNALSHYGVPGMKWGKRTAASLRGQSTPKRKTPSSDHVESRSLKRERPKTLSNSEIKKINERLQLEQSLSKLKQKNSSVSRGHETMKTVLAVGTTAASLYALSQTPAGKTALKLGKDILSRG